LTVKGHVDEFGRALIALPVKASVEAAAVVINVWIDTAFDGDLVIPTSVIKKLGLTQSAAIQATLADGSAVILETFQCAVDWFGTLRLVEAIANDGKFPLLGVGLLRGRKLAIDYTRQTVELI
jgi:clan AA aspartic protease